MSIPFDVTHIPCPLTWDVLWVCWVGQVTISYIDETLPVSRRRHLLADGYKFVCICQECERETSKLACNDQGPNTVKSKRKDLKKAKVQATKELKDATAKAKREASDAKRAEAFRIKLNNDAEETKLPPFKHITAELAKEQQCIEESAAVHMHTSKSEGAQTNVGEGEGAHTGTGTVLTKTAIRGMNPKALKAELKQRKQPIHGSKKELQAQLIKLLAL